MEPPSQKAIGERMDLSRESVKQDSAARTKEHRLFPLPPALRPDGRECNGVLPGGTTERRRSLICRSERDRAVKTITKCRFCALCDSSPGSRSREHRRRSAHGSACDEPARRECLHSEQIEAAR